ncbi:MAG: hypothetical protein AAGB16_07800, partial [Pseudomonadota bacterium]
MKFNYLFPALALGFAACETVPQTMDPMDFDQTLADLKATPGVHAGENALAELLARPDLTEAQRSQALYVRADLRWTAKHNLPGAVADFDAFLALSPDDQRGPEAERHKVFAATEIENAERRLAGLQNLPDWFDDKVRMGRLEEGAARYRKSGLTPTEHQVYVLRDGGYICDGEGAPVHNYGPLPDYVAGAV